MENSRVRGGLMCAHRAHHWLVRLYAAELESRAANQTSPAIWRFVVVGLCTVVPVRLTIRFAYALRHPYSFPEERATLVPLSQEEQEGSPIPQKGSLAGGRMPWDGLGSLTTPE